MPALSLKKVTPAIMVNSGVKEFYMAASELSILVSAMQYKNAGIKLPSKPEIITRTLFSFATFLNAFHAKGNNTMAALNIRIAATW
jgi:hypothetical protein